MQISRIFTPNTAEDKNDLHLPLLHLPQAAQRGSDLPAFREGLLLQVRYEILCQFKGRGTVPEV